MKEIFIRHTGLNLKSILLEVLANYGIKIYQKYSITTDNGSNMLNAVKRLIDEAIEGKRDEQSENDHESGIISCVHVPSPSLIVFNRILSCMNYIYMIFV